MSAQTDELAEWLDEISEENQNSTGDPTAELARVAVHTWRHRDPDGDVRYEEHMLRAAADQFRDRPGWKLEWAPTDPEGSR